MSVRTPTAAAAKPHVFACLVHERADVVVDLVRNLRWLDPEAQILLYDGSSSGRLLHDPAVPRESPVFIHPAPRPMRWGRLHDFALDCMRFALRELEFETLTIVDSDQLLVRPGFAAAVDAVLAARPDVGLLGNAPHPQPSTSRVDPVRLAWREAHLWRPFLARLPGGAEAFLHWTFWPSTVIVRRAAEDLVRVFDDPGLQRILSRTRIWATEEIILPTLVAGLGHGIAASPESFEYVRYRRNYTKRDVDRGMRRDDVFWVHPIPRVFDHPLREHIRRIHGGYAGAPAPEAAAPIRRPLGAGNQAVALRQLVGPDAALLSGAFVRSMLPDDETAWPTIPPLRPLVDRMRPVVGWLEDEEAALLAIAACTALATTHGLPVAEVGSYAGRGTVLLAAAARALECDTRIFAIDRFDGVVGDADQRLYGTDQSLATFDANIRAAGLEDMVEAIVGPPVEATLKGPVGLLVIDGLHDYANVAADFRHFEGVLAPNGLVAFHDYATYFPGVRRFVDELTASGRYVEVGRAGSLIVLRRPTWPAPSLMAPAATVAEALDGGPRPLAVDVATRQEARNGRRFRDRPLVSCVMPTFDRRPYVPTAIRLFLGQDYVEKELIVVDDGTDPVADLIPDDERIRYLRLPGRHSIGAKRNVACEHARGELLAHWDDDDWVASWRLRYEVEALLEQRTDVVGIQTLLYLDPVRRRGWRYRHLPTGRPWVHDPTFLFRRRIWEEEPFPDTNFGLDIRYLGSGRPKRVSVLPDYRFYVGTLHPGNTSTKRTTGPNWRALDVTAIDALIAADTADASGQGHAVAPVLFGAAEDRGRGLERG